MTRRRKILLVLLVIAVAVAHFIWPVVVLNVWEWLEEPEFMQKLVEIFMKEKDNGRGSRTDTVERVVFERGWIVRLLIFACPILPLLPDHCIPDYLSPGILVLYSN